MLKAENEPKEINPLKNFFAALVFLMLAAIFLNEMHKDDALNLTKFHRHWKGVAGEIFLFLVCTLGAISKIKDAISQIRKNKKFPLTRR